MGKWVAFPLFGSQVSYLAPWISERACDPACHQVRIKQTREHDVIHNVLFAHSPHQPKVLFKNGGKSTGLERVVVQDWGTDETRKIDLRA